MTTSSMNDENYNDFPPPLMGEGEGGGGHGWVPPTFTLLDKALDLTLVINNISYLTG